MQDIIESVENVFEKSSISGGQIRNCCLFGGKSLNNRTYTEQAIKELAEHGEGVKAYLDHPSKQSVQEGGIRSIRDWLGTFNTTRKEGQKVMGSLVVRECYEGLMSDIIKISPSKIGFSLNARVKASKGEDGKEVVEGIDLIRSFDLVSSTGTTDNLFESALEGIEGNDDELDAEFDKLMDGLEDEEELDFDDDDEEEDFDCVCSKESIMEAKEIFESDLDDTQKPEEDATNEFINTLRRG